MFLVCNRSNSHHDLPQSRLIYSPEGDKFAVLTATIEQLLPDGLGGGVESSDPHAHHVV
jgi:hypothetical protein